MTIKKNTLKLLFQIPGIDFLTRAGKGAKVLCYHGVEEKIADERVQIAHMPFEYFEMQIKYLQKHFDIISMDYLKECLTNGYQVDSSQICISFDDGYKNNLYNAAQFLSALRIPFTVFIATNHITNGNRLPTYCIRTAILYTDKKRINFPSIEKSFSINCLEDRLSVLTQILHYAKTASQKAVNMILNDCIDFLTPDRWKELNSMFDSDALMDWDEIKRIKECGATIGSHCHDHTILHARQEKSQIDHQLKTSKLMIEDHMGVCDYFSYPNGALEDISEYAVMSLKRHRYALGMTLVSGEIHQKSNPYLLPRIWAPSDFATFKYAVNIKSKLSRTLY